MKIKLHNFASILFVSFFLIFGSISYVTCGFNTNKINTIVDNNGELSDLSDTISDYSINTVGPNGWTITEVVSFESDEVSNLPSLIIGLDDIVHIVWDDHMNYSGSGGDSDIFYKMKQIGGDWTNAELVSTESINHSLFPSLTVEFDGTIHVVWNEFIESANGFWNNNYVFYSMKKPNGSWSTAELVSFGIGGSLFPHIAVGLDGTLHVIWQSVNIYYSFKPKNGCWSNPIVISSRYSNDCSLVIDSENNVHIVWCEDISESPYESDWNICYRIKKSDGEWTDTEIIFDEESSSNNPLLAIDDYGTLHLVWHEYNFRSGSIQFEGIYYKIKKDIDWSGAQLVYRKDHQYNKITSLNFAVQQNGIAHITWSEHFEDYIHNYVFYKMKPVNGYWCDTELVSTESINNSGNPCIDVDSKGIVHVAWGDYTDYNGSGGDLDIFYKKRYPSPSKPIIHGPIVGNVGEENIYRFVSTDPLGFDVYYYIDWGDGKDSGWIGPNKSGEEINVSHTWFKKGEYIIKTKVKNIYGAESIWSTYDVSIPRIRTSFYSYSSSFLEQFSSYQKLRGYI